MQLIKHFLLDLSKITSVIIGLGLIMLLVGYLFGAKSQPDKTMNYFNNIDYAEQVQIDNIQ